MKALLLLPILVLAIGCSSDEASSTTDTKDLGGPASQNASVAAKCDGCGKDVAKAALVSHDGKMMCKDCIAAHNH